MSIKKNKKTYKIAEKFHLKEVLSEEVKKVIKSLNKKKSAISSCIPVEVLIDSVDTYLPIFTNIINSSIRNGTFPEELNLTEVTPLFETADSFDKVSFRPVSLLSHVSEVYERIIFNQISTYFEPFPYWFLQKSQHATFSATFATYNIFTDSRDPQEVLDAETSSQNSVTIEDNITMPRAKYIWGRYKDCDFEKYLSTVYEKNSVLEEKSFFAAV